MDEVLDLLQKTAKRIQKTFDEGKEISSKQTVVYEQILQSVDASETQKAKAFIGRTLELDRLERLSSQLSLLYTLQIFAFKVKVLDISIERINDQLAKAGVFENSAEIEEIKKNINSLKILVNAQYESMKKIREKRSENISYVF